MSADRKRQRCAIYTRKSSEEGLEQEFNSLDAQREASEAYIASQAHEGWQLVRARYDDGGFSGGSMERPGLAALLADIERGRIDVVVVYKIDRLTRSLADFARMVELFDRHEVSFVSVTQAFNTTNSMGRLTLNVLLSFAQFEREVTGERIRDKIAASKAKGMWMGGNLPLGYDPPRNSSRILVVNEDEAAIVRTIFNEYLRLGSVHALESELARRGIRSKSWTASSGREVGGVHLSRGALYHMLRNEIYLGCIRHRGRIHEGGHEAIIERGVFERVKRALADGRDRRHARRKGGSGAPLTGRIFDALGEPMSPTISRGKQGRRYRYYVSTSLQKGRQATPGEDRQHGIVRRISASTLEAQLTQLITRLLPDHSEDPLALPRRIEIHADAVHLSIPRASAVSLQGRLGANERLEEDVADPSCVRLVAIIRIRNRRGRTEIRTGTRPAARRDPVLIGALQRAHAMVELDARRLPFCSTSPDTQYARRLIRLAFLAPDLQRAILDGSQPADLTLEHLMARPLPVAWDEQRWMFEHV